MKSLFDKFKLDHEKETLETVIINIDNGVVFRGTNLWVLIFAIFVASLGLNVNSTAVIIGAMLISPLMAPIMGVGLGIGINDLLLLRKSIYNYAIATGVALATSTLFFLLSPLDDAHSEILARTTPNIYDVLIAVFGGLAGIIATASKQKGNVIPGVAIATALMPPLCTAGYGLATFQFQYFFGAFYLYLINTVFIALATFLVVRFLHFPRKHLQNPRADKIAQRIVLAVVLATLFPSLYFGYDLVQQERFKKNANNFITNEAFFTNDYLLSKKVDPKTKSITLVFGGKEISSKDIANLTAEMKKYDLGAAKLEVKQGFAYLTETNSKLPNEQTVQLTQALAVKDAKEKELQSQLDSLAKEDQLGRQIFFEIKAQYPMVKKAIVQPSIILGATAPDNRTVLILLSISSNISSRDRAKLKAWLKVRLDQPNINLIFER
ncbi:MAG: DUF389 domain-containing protein [Saprospiraceae bacterium]